MKQGYCKAIPFFFFFSKVKAKLSQCAPALSESRVSFLSRLQGIETTPVTGRASVSLEETGLEAGSAQTSICDSYTHPNFVGSLGQHDKHPDLLHRAVSVLRIYPGWKLLLSEKKATPTTPPPPSLSATTPVAFPSAMSHRETWKEIKIK